MLKYNSGTTALCCKRKIQNNAQTWFHFIIQKSHASAAHQFHRHEMQLTPQNHMLKDRPNPHQLYFYTIFDAYKSVFLVL